MVRQAQSYLAGAVSSVALIAAAVVAFVVLISAQAFHDWPLSGLGFGGEGGTAAVAPARPAVPGPASAARGRAQPSPTSSGQGATSGNVRHPSGLDSSAAGVNSPSAGQPASGPGGRGGSGPGGVSSKPAGAGGAAPAPSGGGSSGSSGDGSGGGNGGGPGETEASPIGEVGSQVDETVSGALGNPKATEVPGDVVNGLAGAKSPLGRAVGETVGAVGGLLPADR
jgi:hypothetical protein